MGRRSWPTCLTKASHSIPFGGEI